MYRLYRHHRNRSVYQHLGAAIVRNENIGEAYRCVDPLDPHFGDIYVRPMEEFFGTIGTNGTGVRRFVPVNDLEAPMYSLAKRL
jgi:hypothetical protein